MYMIFSMSKMIWDCVPNCPRCVLFVKAKNPRIIFSNIFRPKLVMNKLSLATAIISLSRYKLIMPTHYYHLKFQNGPPSMSFFSHWNLIGISETPWESGYGPFETGCLVEDCLQLANPVEVSSSMILNVPYCPMSTPRKTDNYCKVLAPRYPCHLLEFPWPIYSCWEEWSLTVSLFLDIRCCWNHYHASNHRELTNEVQLSCNHKFSQSHV